MPEESLRNKAIKSIAWSFIDKISGYLITFIVGIILARLLSPKEYGLIAIITIFISIFNSIIDSGFSNALIQKKNANNIDYNTVFIFNFFISTVLFVLLFVSAPSISRFFNQNELTSITRVMAIILIINSLTLVQQTQLIKKIDFKTQTKISIIASIISGIIGIITAFLNCGVWSLVSQQITKQALNSILLWLYNKWIPKLEFSISSFKGLFSFGWKLLVSGLIDTIWKDVYQIIIGHFYSAATLGQYTRALQFGNLFSVNLTSVIQRVSFPVLSTIQDEEEKLKKSYRKIIRLTMFLSFTLMLGLAAIARPMILVLIGEKWLPCVPYLQIICFSMMLYPLHAINLNMLQVKGRSDLFLTLEIIKKSIAIIPILMGIFVNIYCMLIGSVFVSLISYFINSYYSGREIGYSTKDQIKDIMPSFALALLMSICTYIVSYINLIPIILLIIQIILGIVIVSSISELFKVEEYNEIKTIIVSLIKRKNATNNSNFTITPKSR